jgi:hypothetical protein
VASSWGIQGCLVLHNPLKKVIESLKILLRKKWERTVVCATKEQNMLQAKLQDICLHVQSDTVLTQCNNEKSCNAGKPFHKKLQNNL